jgi:glycosyltransferase involved in cell wall biosynthesis
MQTIAMLLANAFKPDPRVLKEAVHLQKAGFQVVIFCWDRQKELSPEETLASGVHVIRIQNFPSSYGIGTRQLSKLFRFWYSLQPHLRDLKPDVIHCHDFDTLPAGLLFGKRHHLPVIFDAHEYYADLVKPRLKGIFGKMLYRVIKRAEHIGAASSSAVVTVDDTLARVYRHDNPNVIILGHYPEQIFASQPNPVFTRPTLSMIYAGRLSVDRGLLIYIDLLRILVGKGIPARLILAGVYTPVSDKQRFIDYAKGFEKYIIDLGWISYAQMPHTYLDADVGLAILLPEPRYVAAIPVKLFEYMACGLPVIASNFPATAAIIKDADCGVLVDPTGGMMDMANTLASWWQDRSEPARLGENGRQAILTKYNWEKQINRLVELYQSLS